jgi:hypothetical protein
MQLRFRLAAAPETISDFAAAAAQKFHEGIELGMAGRGGAAIYLMGYSAEMLLKVACFRFDGATPADLVAPRLAPAKNWLQARLPALPHEGYHSLMFWSTYLTERRADAVRPLDATLTGELVHHTRRLYQSWWIEMRYRPDQSLPTEVERAYRDVCWLHDQFHDLWR